MHADPRSSAQAPPGPLPLDVFYAVLGQLDDRRDLHAAALVCWAFNRAATPLLYREIDADTRDGQVVHPATTLLARPELARYVHHVRETGVIHMRDPRLTSIALRAIRLCTNIRSFTWSADTSSSPAVFEDFLDALAGTDLRALTLRTYHDLGYQVWSKLNRIAGLTKVVVWSMEGPPRYLQGWAGLLGNTLTELELGRCANVPAGELVSVLAQLPRLRDLRLKGAPSSAMYDILACLPALASLDTEYLGNGNAHAPNAPTMTGPPMSPSSRPPLRSRLRRLTVRTSSVDLQGPKELWDWLPQLIPLPSLEEFTLNAFSTQGYMTVAPRFLQFLRHVHGETLRLFCVNQSQLALPELAHLCAMFPALEELSCAVTSSNAAAISGAIAHARVLRTVKLHVFRGRGLTIPGFGDNSPAALFSKKDAEALMTRKGSSIRKLSMGQQQFTARWVPTRDRDGESTAELVVEEDKREQGHW